MKVLILTVIVAIPLMVFGQKEEQPQPQGQTNEAPATTTEKTAPATTTEKTAPATTKETNAQAKPQRAATDERGQTDVRGRARDAQKAEGDTRAESGDKVKRDTDVKERSRDANKTDVHSSSSTSRTKVSVDEFRSRHSEVFNLGRHPKEFFIQKYGEKHFRLIGNTYFIFLDGCWVAVDVDGFTYTQRVICAGDPDYVEIVD